MFQNVMGEGEFIMFDELPISTKELSERRFQISFTCPCSRSEVVLI